LSPARLWAARNASDWVQASNAAALNRALQTPKCRRPPESIARSPATPPTSPIGRTIQHDRARGALNADQPRPWSASGQLPYAWSGRCPSPLAECRMPDSWSPLLRRPRALRQPAPCGKVPTPSPSFTRRERPWTSCSGAASGFRNERHTFVCQDSGVPRTCASRRIGERRRFVAYCAAAK
jgi:hypothetical protein